MKQFLQPAFLCCSLLFLQEEYITPIFYFRRSSWSACAWWASASPAAWGEAESTTTPSTPGRPSRIRASSSTRTCPTCRDTGGGWESTHFRTAFSFEDLQSAKFSPAPSFFSLDHIRSNLHCLSKFGCFAFWSLSKKVRRRYGRNKSNLFSCRYPIGSYVGKRGRGFGDESEEEVIEDVDPRWIQIVQW